MKVIIKKLMENTLVCLNYSNANYSTNRPVLTWISIRFHNSNHVHSRRYLHSRRLLHSRLHILLRLLMVNRQWRHRLHMYNLLHIHLRHIINIIKLLYRNFEPCVCAEVFVSNFTRGSTRATFYWIIFDGFQTQNWSLSKTEVKRYDTSVYVK